MSRVLLYVLLFAVGTGLGTALTAFDIVSPSDKEFWRSGMTAISILSGFMVTTMVFTGKIEAAKSLNATELRQVSAKLTHLLLNQFGTLANHLLCLSAMFFTPSIADKLSLVAKPIAVISLALFFVSLVRSMFVPLQIIELHRFTHAALLRDKRDEAIKDSAKM